jgi:hypothetical protein
LAVEEAPEALADMVQGMVAVVVRMEGMGYTAVKESMAEREQLPLARGGLASTTVMGAVPRAARGRDEREETRLPMAPRATAAQAAFPLTTRKTATAVAVSRETMESLVKTADTERPDRIRSPETC